MPALLEAVADLEVEELEIVLATEHAETPKRTLETVVIVPHGLEAKYHDIYAIDNCFYCVDTCCCGGCGGGCYY